MEIGIAFDNTVPLHMASFLNFINSNSIAIHCHEIVIHPVFRSAMINGNDEVKRIKGLLPASEENNTLSLIVTTVPFDNNYFSIGDGQITILSLSEWQILTSLPMTNGIGFFLCKIIIKHRLRIGTNHDEPVGCISDFLWDKRGIDVGMRAAFLCDRCREHSANDKNIKSQEFIDIMTILNHVSIASRNGEDVLNEKSFMPKDVNKPLYDVFICHNAVDKPIVRQFNSVLKRATIRTWLDEDQIRPGEVWQDKLETEISQISSCVIIVGDSRSGPWQDMERRAFINEFANRGCKLIPVLIGSPDSVPELPIFLRQFMWAGLISALRPQ